MVITNPILRGFHPDPSIIRVKDDFYLATSTFEWFPGIQLYHSKDLGNWSLLNHPLNSKELIDLSGNPDSCGVWAPCLSYKNGTYYLVYSNVRSFKGAWKDTHNYLTTSKDIHGSWDTPVYLDSRGFDASLFHDTNGKSYYISMLVNHNQQKLFGGIVLQEFCTEKKQLIGEVHHIFDGTPLGCTEGPHLYQKDGYYYLLTAEGGTEYGHAVTLSRSKHIFGPYEPHPNNPILSAKDNANAPLQKTGHADIVDDSIGNWYMVYLAGRPLTTKGRCTLGRETCITKLTWPDSEWPALSSSSPIAPVEVDLPLVKDYNNQLISRHYHFKKWNNELQSLRIPITEEWLSINERPAYLRLKGQESLSSLHHQSLVARRVQHFKVKCTTVLEFAPENFQQMAGLIFYYNTCHFHYLYITKQGQKRIISIITYDKSKITEQEIIPINHNSAIRLQGVIAYNELQFYYSIDNNEYKKIGPILDASILSDDYVRDEKNVYQPAFTGMFVGLCCQDLTGKKLHADFKYFEYEEYA